MKFSFPLESLFQLRIQLEEQKQLEYGQVMQKWQQAKEQKQQLEQKQQWIFQQWRKKIQGKDALLSSREYGLYLKSLQKEIKNAEGRCIELECKVEIKRKELLEAVKQRKMMESLKNKALENFRKEEQRKEQQIIDELVTFRYYNRQT